MSEGHPQRFHALDATRAFALLLGVLFHAVWFYVLPPCASPVSDIRANALAGWIFVTSHLFRMQLFFLLAGFFAHLVLEQRGLRTFAFDRLKRIALPLLIGWQTIIPVLQLIWTWGTQLSGQQDTRQSLFEILATQYQWDKFLVPAGLGGSFGLGHLWFLYYLLLFYVAILVGKWAALKTRGPSSALSRRVDVGVYSLARSVWGPIILAIICTPLLSIMHGWIGVDLPGGFPTPQLSVLAVYGVFFLFGWLVHRLANRLSGCFLHWRIHLGIGLVVSIGLFAAYHHLRFNFLFGLQYPSLTVQDVQDWTEFRKSLVGQSVAERAAPCMKQLWEAIPMLTRAHLTSEAALTMDECQGIIFAVNQVIVTATDLSLRNRSDGLSITTNRERLQPYLKGVSATKCTRAKWYWPVKVLYGAGCSLVMCTLVFGTLGAFQALCSGFSPTWRYIADASYWIYLVHLPLLIAIEILMYRWNITAFLKISVLLLGSLLFSLATYHYLVRSTFIGKLLNGRAYPFRAYPWKRETSREDGISFEGARPTRPRERG